MTPQPSQKARPVGRPPAGARDGEKVQDYPQLSLRLPADVKARLQALSLIEARPQWRVIADAIECYAKARPDAERRLVAELAGRSQGRARRGPGPARPR